MKCRVFEEHLSDLIDGRLDNSLRIAMNQHQAGCSTCGESWQRAIENRNLIGHAATQTLVRPVPADLQMRLRVLASKEHQYATNRRDWAARWQLVRQKVWLWTENIMQPLMVPATGGLASTLLLFALLTPLPAFKTQAAAGDIPLPRGISEARLRFVPAVSYEADITVNLMIDQHGRMMGYHVVEGGRALSSNERRRQFETALLLMEFNPATEYGKPKWGQVQIVFRSNAAVEIKG
jgi:hypothetical protein